MTAEPRFLEVQCISPAGLHRMAYTEWGDPHNPRVLLCVHGVSRVSGDFDDLARAMCSEYRVVCPDVVGRGRSQWLADAHYYAVPTYVADMVVLLARLNAETLDWFGTSMGGLIGMGLAAMPGNPIHKLVLNDVGPSLNLPALARIGNYIGAELVWDSYAEARAAVRELMQPFGPHAEAQWEHLTSVVLKQRPDGKWTRHYDLRIADNFRVSAGLDPNVANQQLMTLYDAIRCPTLAVRGELSDLLTRATHAEMAQRGPRATLVEIPGVGHAPTFIQPEQIAIARDFLLN